MLNQHLKDTLSFMLSSLLEVGSDPIQLIQAPVPAYTGHMIKVSMNPIWFRELIQRRPVRTRKDRTIQALRRLVGESKKFRSINSFDTDLIDSADNLLEQWGIE